MLSRHLVLVQSRSLGGHQWERRGSYPLQETMWWWIKGGRSEWGHLETGFVARSTALTVQVSLDGDVPRPFNYGCLGAMFNSIDFVKSIAFKFCNQPTMFLRWSPLPWLPGRRRWTLVFHAQRFSRPAVGSLQENLSCLSRKVQRISGGAIGGLDDMVLDYFER